MQVSRITLTAQHPRFLSSGTPSSDSLGIQFRNLSALERVNSLSAPTTRKWSIRTVIHPALENAAVYVLPLWWTIIFYVPVCEKGNCFAKIASHRSILAVRLVAIYELSRARDFQTHPRFVARGTSSKILTRHGLVLGVLGRFDGVTFRQDREIRPVIMLRWKMWKCARECFIF